MIAVTYRGKRGTRLSLVEREDLVVVRTRDRGAVEHAPLSRSARGAMAALTPVIRFPDAGVVVLRSTRPTGRRQARDRARRLLGQEPSIEFAGRVLADRTSGRPVLYTENLFVQFREDEDVSRCRRLLKKHGLAPKRELAYAPNAWFVGAEPGSGQEVFAVAQRLLAEEAVALCHPELVRPVRRRGAFPQQWHLAATRIAGALVDAHAAVAAAWETTRGAGVTIALIDDGVDVDHEEFRSPGKIVAPWDATRRRADPRPGSGDDHGTSCAGVACADGRFGASGVAPEARLMPIRLTSGLGSQNEADAFQWAVDHGADVISCSWGPEDGEWSDPADPLHRQVFPLPDATRLAIDYATSRGRNGRGCLVLWAAGNGNESAANDGYVSYPSSAAVAACNDSGKRSCYSDHGPPVWCAFPSSDLLPAKTPGIWTVDRTGAAGYNLGRASEGDEAGNYTNSFGGTSSAAPGAAGVAALLLARNPELRWNEVKDVLKRCCDRIDPGGGRYDADGHSDLYGYGRLNARRAVELARPARPDATEVRSTIRDVPIRDLRTARLSVPVADTRPVKEVRVRVDLDHAWIGDLLVTLRPPRAVGAGPVVLHDRTGGAGRAIRTTYDRLAAPGLAALAGRSPAGTWALTVKDTARQDQGTLHAFAVELVY
jgi:subtilisin family serine protease